MVWSFLSHTCITVVIFKRQTIKVDHNVNFSSRSLGDQGDKSKEAKTILKLEQIKHLKNLIISFCKSLKFFRLLVHTH